MKGESALSRAFDLSGRVVIITGATRGLGREMAALLAEAGARVVATGRSESDLRTVLTDCAVKGVDIDSAILDVRDVSSIRAAVEEIRRRHDRIDVLVNNAGLGDAHAPFEVTEADWDEMMAVNLRGVFFTSQAVAQVMAAQDGGGRIINVSSQAGTVALPNAAVYCASKGGVNMLTKALALEWASLSINVNAVAPTFIYTPGTAPILDDPDTRSSILAKIPLGRLGTPEDVAAAVAYLATDAARLITGTVVTVDGGWTAQ